VSAVGILHKLISHIFEEVIILDGLYDSIDSIVYQWRYHTLQYYKSSFATLNTVKYRYWMNLTYTKVGMDVVVSTGIFSFRCDRNSDRTREP